MAIKIPLAVLATFLVGLFVSLRKWRHAGHAFVLFMLFFWIVPYSLVGAKWLRYTLSLMPFVYMSAAIGAMALIRWSIAALEKLKAGPVGLWATAAIFVMLLVAWPAWTAYAASPHYALYTNSFGRGYTGFFFPHDEFYDDGLNEAIRFVCEHAPRDAMIVSETPGAVKFYAEKFGRTDLQSNVLSDPKFTVPEASPVYVIMQRGRTYFENQDEMKQVRDRLTLVYAGCIDGHTAAEVYAVMAGPGEAVKPCGDVRP